MTEADSILAGERSRNRPDRIVNAFAPGYVIVESNETDNTMCIMTFTNAPGEGPPPHTHTVEDETFILHEGVLEFYEDESNLYGASRRRDLSGAG
jgi:quercetin dioxygenase-like cupin family protein